jgi:oligoendopeptidase F
MRIKERKFYGQTLTAKKWGPMKKELKALFKMEINSSTDLLLFIEKYTELYNIFEDETIQKVANYLCHGNFKSIMKLVWYALKVGLKGLSNRSKVFKFIYNSPYFSEIPEEHFQLKRIIEKENTIKNSMLLMAREYYLVLKYNNKIGKTRVEYEGQKISLQKLGRKLLDPDNAMREKVWRTIQNRILEDEENINKIYDSMRKIRMKQAKKNNFDNYRDFIHLSKGRFDWKPEQCFEFHDAVEEIVVPYIKELNQNKQNKLGLENFRPWDKALNPEKAILKPYDDINDLLDKLIIIFGKIRPEYGETLKYMKDNNLIDAENRRGKMPGAMSLPLADQKAAFILANAIGVNDDVETIAHEGGHSMHWAAISDLPVAMYREIMLFPMELAEVSSMTMEFLIFDFLNEIYTDSEDIKQAKKEALISRMRFLPWCMMVDAFQHWVYTNPNHTVEERKNYFNGLMDRFECATGVDYSGLEAEKGTKWLRQSHIFASPFYYIEYGISQLAAFAIYRNYKQNREKAFEQYHNFLKLGNSKPIHEIYEAAGIKFDFSKEYVRELIEFIKKEINELDN